MASRLATAIYVAMVTPILYDSSYSPMAQILNMKVIGLMVDFLKIVKLWRKLIMLTPKHVQPFMLDGNIDNSQIMHNLGFKNCQEEEGKQKLHVKDLMDCFVLYLLGTEISSVDEASLVK